MKSLTNLVVPPQSALSADRRLWVPLLLRNDSHAAADITLHSDLPAGWTGNTEDREYHLQPGTTYPIQLHFNAPGHSGEKSPEMLSWSATQNGVRVGETGLSVYLEYNHVPQ